MGGSDTFDEHVAGALGAGKAMVNLMSDPGAAKEPASPTVFKEGMRVVPDGLKGRPDLNGKLMIVTPRDHRVPLTMKHPDRIPVRQCG